MTPEASIEASLATLRKRHRMTVTLNDVARRAGVSKSTVSNVVRGAAPVAPSTRRRVEGAISELGYRPNEVARALKQRSTQTLGLVITDTVNPFAASLAQAVVRRARRDGYAVLIADTDGDPQIEAAQVRALVARRVDGVIFAALTEGSTNLGDLLDREVPTVLASFGGGLDRRAGAIDIDEEEAMDNVVQYLADLGHERIAFARQHAREADVDRRPNAFSKAMRKRNLQEVSLEDAPTAICCMNDGVAIDLMDSLERSGRRVPEDVSVVGFDDVPLASHHRIRLTTVRQDAATIGARAAGMLLVGRRRGPPGRAPRAAARRADRARVDRPEAPNERRLLPRHREALRPAGARPALARPRRARRQVPRPARPLGLRQDHRAAHPRRARAADRRRGAHRRSRRDAHAAARPRRRDGLPELRALPAHDGRRERRLPAAHPRPEQGRAPRAGARRSPSRSRSRTCSTAGRGTSPAASASASRSPGRSCASRRCS